MFKSIDVEASKIKQRILSLDFTRGLLIQYGKDCNDVEKKIVMLTIRYICLRIAKLSMCIAFFFVIPYMLCKAIFKVKK